MRIEVVLDPYAVTDSRITRAVATMFLQVAVVQESLEDVRRAEEAEYAAQVQVPVQEPKPRRKAARAESSETPAPDPVLGTLIGEALAAHAFPTQQPEVEKVAAPAQVTLDESPIDPVALTRALIDEKGAKHAVELLREFRIKRATEVPKEKLEAFAKRISELRA